MYIYTIRSQYIYVHVNNYEHAERNGRNSLRVRLDITHASGRWIQIKMQCGYNVVPPQWCLLVYRNSIDISTINHSEIGVMFTNLAIPNWGTFFLYVRKNHQLRGYETGTNQLPVSGSASFHTADGPNNSSGPEWRHHGNIMG